MPFAERSAFNFGQLGVLRITSGSQPGRDGGDAPGTSGTLELDFSGWSHGGRWALQLDIALGRAGDPVLVVAQGLACLAVAWWAQLSPKSYLERVGGALFLSPLSFSPSEASVARSLRPSPGTKLPFPSIVSSPASPIIGQVLDLADIWGSQFVDADASADAARGALKAHPLGQQARLLELIDASWAPASAADLVDPAYLRHPTTLAAVE